MEIAGGDHYFVSTHYRAVVEVVREQLVGLMAGGLMDGHSWIDEKAGAAEALEVRSSIDSTVWHCRDYWSRSHSQTARRMSHTRMQAGSGVVLVLINAVRCRSQQASR